MARPLRIEFPGAYYHIASRGNEQKEIFRNSKDREKFLSYLESASKRYGAEIHLFCLMNNHYHLLLKTPRGNLSKVMHHINGAYTTYFNTQWNRVGHLFQGRFKAILVDADEYACELSRYIHLNPVRAAIVSTPGEYGWSSYLAYTGRKKVPGWLHVDFILSYFGEDKIVAQKRYHTFVHDLIGTEYENPLEKTYASTILGDESFIDQIRREHLENEKNDRNIPAMRKMTTPLSIQDIVKEIGASFPEDTALVRQASLYLCHRYSGRSLKEIGNYFLVGESAISQGSRRFKKRMMDDPKLMEKIETIVRSLHLSNV